MRIRFKGREQKKRYVTDFFCYDQIVVEIKAADVLCSKDEAQLTNALDVSKTRVGLLINFGSVGRLDWKRSVV